MRQEYHYNQIENQHSIFDNCYTQNVRI
jgi:hypothetical protein